LESRRSIELVLVMVFRVQTLFLSFWFVSMIALTSELAVSRIPSSGVTLSDDLVSPTLEQPSGKSDADIRQ
jgi:hypothetical protein